MLLSFLSLRCRLICLWLILLGCSPLRAGLPEPGLTYYGRVYNNNNLVTTGNLTWTLTPAGGGAPVSVTVPLGNLSNGFGETWSYIVEFPAQFVVSGSSLPANTLGLTDSNANYTRSAKVNGTAATLGSGVSATVALSGVSRGSVERVDLAIGGFVPEPGNPPSAPILIGPADGSDGLAPNSILLDWLDSTGATTYNMLLWRDGDAQPANPNVTNLNLSLLDLPGGIATGQRYFWQVIAVGPGGNTPGPRWSFSTLSGNAPNLTFTANAYQVNEHQGPAQVGIALSGSSATSVTAQFETREIGSAVAGVNFTPQVTQVSLSNALTLKNLAISIINDGKPRDEKVFQVALRNIRNAFAPPPQTADVRITDQSIGSILDFLLGRTNDGTDLDRNGDTKVDIADLVLQSNNLQPLAPTQPSPGNGQANVGIRPTFTWDRTSARDRGYDFYLWPAGQPQPGTPTVANLSSPAAVIASDLAFGTTYYWQVVVIGASENTYGPLWSFSTVQPPPVQLISPNSGSFTVGNQIPVHWKTRPDAGSSVRIELWRNGAKVQNLGDGNDPSNEATTNVIVPNVTPASNYRLRVYSYWLESQSAPLTFAESTGNFVIAAP